ncbi:MULTISPECIES: class I SAM-dependent methyltransferase [Methylomonas]|uniref:Methyltransferase type 12 n=2 Tax=Methylomonas TaxID=416 RepID=A0A140E3X9_9GAMM|nr:MULTISPECIES: class I SAM-dependent methyltransferase [Methylomonas]AMK75103.1 hypothetical protein JT25_001160 [Methylomonas denitrificans]OAI02593.1 hypothetical protein A1342_02150 [Methylomonas methanica]TCV83082.1 methyltransferase family protein [Methylomonas methanica]
MDRKFPETVWESYRQFQNESIELNECTDCGFGRFEPLVSGNVEFYENISAIDYYNDDKWEFGSALCEIQSAGANRILDVGCGSGIFLNYLKRHMPNAELVGYDLNAEILSKLAVNGVGVLSGDLSQIKKLSVDEAKFDAVCILQTLEHVRDPVDFLLTFLGLLRPGGVLIITTPNAAGPIRNFPDALTEVPPHHITRWTEAALGILLRNQGLKINTVQFEPLPEYLWDAYLPEMWDEPIWPARILDPLARRNGMLTVGERSGFAAKLMRDAGVRWLYGVAGHTIFVAATREYA